MEIRIGCNREKPSLIVISCCEPVSPGKFPRQLLGTVDQDREMLSADLEFTSLESESHQRHFAVSSGAVDAGIFDNLCHGGYTGKVS